MIPESNKRDVIQSSISFIRSITAAYGSEEGIALWATIADTVDPDLKGQIFVAMLMNEYPGQVVLHPQNCSGINRVDKVKALRIVDVRHLGLKESIDILNTLESGQTVTLEVNSSNRDGAISKLRSAGFIL